MKNEFTKKEIEHIQLVKSKIEDKCNEISKMEWYDPRISWSDAFLAGGAIASLIQGQEPRDWDIYFKRMDAANDARRLIEKSMGSFIEKYEKNYMGEDDDSEHKKVTANAITLKGGVSFISTFAGEPLEVKKTFDFVHCTPHYDIPTNKLYISKKQYLAALKKVLIVNGKKVPLEWRRNKFIQRGYTE